MGAIEAQDPGVAGHERTGRGGGPVLTCAADAGSEVYLTVMVIFFE